MGTGSDWLPIVAAILSRWWYPWTLYASQHSSNGKSASRLLEVGCRGHERTDVVSRGRNLSREFHVFEDRTSSAHKTVHLNEGQ